MTFLIKGCEGIENSINFQFMLCRNKTFRWAGVILAILLVRWMQLAPERIEQFYARGAYLSIGQMLRGLTGWLPFSMGDMLYMLAVLWLIYWLVRTVMTIRSGQFNQQYIKRALISGMFISACIYIIFNVLWGMNYERAGVASQFGLAERSPSDTSLLRLTAGLRDRLNVLRQKQIPSELSDMGQFPLQGYRKLATRLPIPNPEPVSVKASLFGSVGNYLGYSGYFNPFTGEAQVNTSIPLYMIPFVTAHEMAHQLGYAREDEASFIGHLAATASADAFTQYSSYLNMFLYAHRELRQVDSTAARVIWESVTPAVQSDIQEYRRFLRRHDSVIGEWVDAFYDRYLRWNDQPAGTRTYSRVVIWLVAWQKKYGDV
jgi:hypothetical protein